MYLGWYQGNIVKRKVSKKKICLYNSIINFSNYWIIILYTIQKQPLKACNFIKKEILAQIFSCEFCEISKNTFSYRTLWWLLLNVTSLRVNKFSIWLLFTLFIWILFTYIYYIQCHGRILNFRRMFYTLVFTMFSWCLLRQRRNNKQTKKTMTNMSELM